MADEKRLRNGESMRQNEIDEKITTQSIVTRSITGHTGLLAVIGSPIRHSVSPEMHNYAFGLLGLDYVYVALEIKEEETEEAFRAMKLFHMKGCNVTMPCKTRAAQLVDKLSPAAAVIGAVNTVVNENGCLIGYNTDGEGFVRNLKDHGVSVAGKKITVTGCGGAATSLLVQCALDKAAELIIFNRTIEKAEAVAEKIKKAVPEIRISVFSILDEERMKKEMADSDIFINATNVGMTPNEEESVVKDVSVFHPGLVVADAVYHPLETRLLREAKAAGCQCVNGKGMLLWQGAAAFSLFTGEEMPVEEVKRKFFSEA